MQVTKRLFRILNTAFLILALLIAYSPIKANDESGTSEDNYTEAITSLTPHQEAVESVSDGASQRKSRSLLSLPASYSSLTQGNITSVKDQGSLGTCWTYAAMACAEAYLLSNDSADGVDDYNKDTLDLDELHLAYYGWHQLNDPLGLVGSDHTEWQNSTTGYLTTGGNNWITMFTLADWAGYVNQLSGNTASLPYDVDGSHSFISNLSKDTTFSNGQDSFILTDAYVINMDDVSTIKNLLMTYGAGDIAIYWNSQYNNYMTDAYYCNDATQYANHEVTLVGWDDNYASTNFKTGTQPTSNGAWLIKNSWSDMFGDNGYFWVSYGDAVLSNAGSPSYSQATFYTVKSKDTYDNAYQYDGTKSASYIISSYNTSISGANVFTAQKSEQLNAVSFYTYDQTNINYNVSVYLMAVDSSNPTSGTKVADLSGTQVYSGYHTVELSTPVNLTKNQKFSVVLTLSKSGSGAKMLFEQNWTESGQLNSSSISAGQSYLKNNYTNSWTDMSTNYTGNLRIKAFTTNEVPATAISVDKDSVSLLLKLIPNAQLTATVTPSDSTDVVSWTSSNDSIAAVDQTGKVTAVSNGTVTITAKIEARNLSDTCTVNVTTTENNLALTLPDGYTDNKVFVDGVEYTGSITDGVLYAKINTGDMLTLYHYKDSGVPDDMKVYILSYSNDIYTATKIDEFDNLIAYHGFSMRIVGITGMRVKSSISTTNKTKLKSASGLAGYHIVEAGTIIMNKVDYSTYPLVKGGTKTGCGKAYYTNDSNQLVDSVFETKDGRERYTSVITKIPVKNYNKVISFRGYVTVEKDGKNYTIYGPIVSKSMYEVAVLVKKSGQFKEGTDAYNFIQNIIDTVEKGA